MNRRIRLLAKQAGMWRQHYDIGLESPAGLEKFAQLIVRECMTQIQQVREIKAGHAGPEYIQGFDDGMFVAISTIEEHFGVDV